MSGVPSCPRCNLKEASPILDRMLWLNPSDSQGVRFAIGEVRAKRAWEDRRDKTMAPLGPVRFLKFCNSMFISYLH